MIWLASRPACSPARSSPRRRRRSVRCSDSGRRGSHRSDELGPSRGSPGGHVSQSILVVDDEPGIMEIAAAYLRRDGFTVRTATTGRRALDAVATQVPDLIVLDLMLPDISGEEVCVSLRRSTSVPILMLTAKSSETDRVRG